MYILDTCILNILFFYPAKRDAVERKIHEVGRSSVWVSTISYYELIVIGVCPQVAQKINKTGAVRELKSLSELVVKLSAFQTLPYTEEDEMVFQTIPAEAKRKGPIDCRIAASALTRPDAVIVTEDETAFELAGVTCVDWTKI